MTGTFEFQKKAIVLAIILPVAALMGYLLATPEDMSSIALVGLMVGALTIPIFLRWHYPILIFSWNAAIIVFFLPGQPSLWMLMACVSIFFSYLASILNKELKLQHFPALTWTILFIAAVVVGTAMATGGIGLRSFGGSTYGGKNYFLVLFAIVGYFALSCHRIAPQRVQFYAMVFLGSGLTLGLGNLAYLAGEKFFWLFYIFPIDYVVNQASEDFFGTAGAMKFGRLSGFSWAGLAVFSMMLVRYGLRGILDFGYPWRIAVCVVLFCVSLLGGFRSIIVIYGLLIAFQFYFERLYRTRVLPSLLIIGVLVGLFMITFAQSLPLSVQRSLSVLPIEVDPAAKADADASTDWRLRMWKVLLPEIPKYFWLGKGYTANATDHWLAVESFRRGLSEDIEISLLAGDYHNGPLSVLLPFGIWGMLAFLAFIVAALRVLYRNYRYGLDSNRLLNTFFLSYFIARLVFFFTVFGALNSDLWLFVGIAGMSMALNGGVARPIAEPGREEQLDRTASPSPPKAFA